MRKIRINFICGATGKPFAVEYERVRDGLRPSNIIRQHGHAHGDTNGGAGAGVDVDFDQLKNWDAMKCPWCGHSGKTGHKNFSIRCGTCKQMVCGAAARQERSAHGEGLWFTCPCGAQDWVTKTLRTVQAQDAPGPRLLGTSGSRRLLEAGPTQKRLPAAMRLLPPPKRK